MKNIVFTPNRIVWTDGSSLGNPGHAGWAALIDGQIYSGYAGIRTNNEAEILAVHNGILKLAKGDRAVIFTDSQLVIGWMQNNWACNNDWIRAYRDIIFLLIDSYQLSIEFKKVAGHSGVDENTTVDHYARQAAREGQNERDKTLWYPHWSP